MKRALFACLLLSCAIGAQSATAAYDPLGGGTVKLTLDPRFASFLRKDGIALAAIEGATKKGSAYSLSVTAGQIDPTTGKGEIDPSGGLVFRGGRKKVLVRKIAVKTKHSPLLAKVGGSQLKVASTSKLSFQRVGFDSAFGAKGLALSAKVATRLNKKLRPKVPFKAGQLLGSLSSLSHPLTTTIEEGGRATLVFDSGFLAKLSSHFVSVNPVFPAEHQGATFTFPIIRGGALAPDSSQGTLRTGGVVELLQLGGGQVFWQEFWLDFGAHSDSAEVDLEPSPAFPGKIGRTGVFDAAPGSASSDPRARTISDSGIALTLTAQTAKALDDAFAGGQPLFGAGEAAGVLSFTAQGQ